MKSRAPLAFLLVFLLLASSCAPDVTDVPDEPALSASVTEEIVTVTDTLPEPEPTEEITEELTSPPETEEVTEESTEEITETSPPETENIENFSADQVLEIVELRKIAYYSFVRRTLTSVRTDILGSETFTETDSELRVKDNSAHLRRGGKDGFENLYLVGEELYTENSLGKCRIGGYGKEEFFALAMDMPIMLSFCGGNMQNDGDNYMLTFSELGDAGKNVICEMLGLPEEYSVSFGKTQLSMTVDGQINMLSSSVLIELSVSIDGMEVMTVEIKTETEQSGFNREIELKIPAESEYVFFTDDESLARYSSLIGEIGVFSSSYNKYEYSVSDDMLISSGTMKLPLTSKTVYAYNSKIGASIDKAFDIGDGTGKHTTLTHFNYRRGFSQIDGGSIFVDTTVNAQNLGFTFYYPFTTSFFSFEHCVGMDPARSDASTIALSLRDGAVKNIADNLLLRVGVFSSSAKLSDVTAFTYIKLGTDGKIAAIGYEFSALADVGGKTYELSRHVELEIVSRDSANVKVIYIEVEDDE